MKMSRKSGDKVTICWCADLSEASCSFFSVLNNFTLISGCVKRRLQGDKLTTPLASILPVSRFVAVSLSRLSVSCVSSSLLLIALPLIAIVSLASVGVKCKARRSRKMRKNNTDRQKLFRVGKNSFMLDYISFFNCITQPSQMIVIGQKQSEKTCFQFFLCSFLLASQLHLILFCYKKISICTKLSGLCSRVLKLA